jgi:hypothetical protein
MDGLGEEIGEGVYGRNIITWDAKRRGGFK